MRTLKVCWMLLALSGLIYGQYVTDSLPYAPIANPLPDTMDQLYRDSVNIKFSPIRINQAGYRPQDKKYFYYVGTASNFSVIGVDGKVVGTGALTSTGKTVSGQLKIKASNNAQLVSGGDTRYLMNSPEFSGPLQEGLIPDLPAGKYRVVVKSDTSHPFVVDEKVYTWVRDALLKFYGVNRCGNSQSWFHKGCHLKDSVTGGWHDCGDHLKEGATMSYTAAVLGLAAAVFADRDIDVYSANQGITQVTDGFHDNLYEAKHGADFVLQSYDKAKGQVGNMITSIGGFGGTATGAAEDHSWWGRPENQDMMSMARGGPPRPARNEPTTDYLGKYAANLAFVSKLMLPYDTAYSARCLKVAKAIYEFTKPKKDRTNTAAYNGETNVSDDGAFACLALLWATGERKYLDELCYDKTIGVMAKDNYQKLFTGGWFTYYDPVFSHSTANTDWASSQAHVLWGFFRLVLNNKSFCDKLNLSENDRLTLIEKTVYNLAANLSSVGLGSQSIQLPENGFWVPPVVKYDLPWFTMHTQMEWVWNRYQAGNITEMYYYYDVASKIQGMQLPGTPASTDWKADTIKTVLVRMLDYMFGVNPWDISMIYGVGSKNFNHPHHRAANPEGKNVPGAFYKYCPPVGALQGGYKPLEGANVYSEHFNDYFHSETGIDGTTNILMPVIGLSKEDTIGPPTGTARTLYFDCNKAIIEIRQSRYGDAVVKYGKGELTDKSVSSDSSGVLHRIVLSGLEEGTKYSYNVVVTDKFGRQSVIKNINEEYKEVDFTFTTLQNCPTNADIQNVKICNVTSDSAEIFWYTPNGEFDSKVVFGDNIPPAIVQDGDVSGHPVKFHYVKIGGLKEKTKYYFYVESGKSRDDNNGQYYTFTTPVEFVKFDVRTLRYEWDNIPSMGINVVNQDSKAYDSLEVRLYFRSKEGLEKELGARLDICVLYREDGYQTTIAGDLRTAIWNNLVKQKPVKMEDTYNPADQTYAYYLTLPLWGVQMRSQSRIRLDIMFVRWEPDRGVDQLNEPTLHQITNADWSFGPHSKTNGDPVDFPGVPNLPKDDVDNSYWTQPINYYVTIYRKEEYVWGYSPSKKELATKKTHYELKTQVTSPINNPNADYYLHTGTQKTITVKGYANLTPVDGKINDIWVNGLRLANPSSFVTWSEKNQNYDFSVPVPVKNGRNLVDVTLFAGPSSECQECYGCAMSNHSFFLEAPFIQQYPSQLVLKDQSMQPLGDTAKLDTTKFHVIVTDRNGNLKGKVKDTVYVKIRNPLVSDSITVLLLETGDSTGTFQTITPISVVSLPPAQSGNDQITMTGGDKISITYIDPTDSTDISEAYLYSKADFPVAQRGYLKDTNGDGAIDRLEVEYTIALKNVPDSIQISFPDKDGMRIVKGPGDAMQIKNQRFVSIDLNPQLQGGTTGFSYGLSGDAKSYLVAGDLTRLSAFKVYDSAGPALSGSAFVYERSGAETGIRSDTLIISFTEYISLDKLINDTLMLHKGGITYPLVVKKMLDEVSGSYTKTLIVEGSVSIAEGDSIALYAKGKTVDLSGNHPHELNRPVPIKLKASAPRITMACYKDNDHNGYIDQIVVQFSKDVALANLAGSFIWNFGEKNPVTGRFTYATGVQNMINVDVTGYFQTFTPATNGVMTVFFVHSDFPADTIKYDVSDSAAPVIVSAVFFPTANTTGEIIDTLMVTFSENVQPVSSVEPFRFLSIASGAPYSMSVQNQGTVISEIQKFNVKAISGVDFPGNNDSIRIDIAANVTDEHGIVQVWENNRRVAMQVNPMPFTVKIDAGPNPLVTNQSIATDDGMMPEAMVGKAGIVVKVSPIARVVTKVKLSGTVTIYDALGNVVYSSELVNSRGSSSNKYFQWNGINKRKRLVAPGTYLAIISVRDEAGIETRERLCIGVK